MCLQQVVYSNYSKQTMINIFFFKLTAPFTTRIHTQITTMAAVKRLYNPFREEADGDTTIASTTKGEGSRSTADASTTNTTTANTNKHEDPFAGVAFHIPSETDYKANKDAQDDHSFDPYQSDFDPFHISDAVAVTTNSALATPPPASAPKKVLKSLAPKLHISLSSHEEVTSVMKMPLDAFDTTTEVTIEGTIKVRPYKRITVLVLI